MKRLFVLLGFFCCVVLMGAMIFNGNADAGKPPPTGCAAITDQATCEADCLCGWSTKKGGACKDDDTCSPGGCTDGDSDGYGDPASPDCTYPELDCDDTDPAVNPGATEECENGKDDDCVGGDATCGSDPNHSSLTYSDYPTACLGCHDGGMAGTQYGDMFNSVHYQWEGATPDMVNGPGLQGKISNAMNTYCINILGNWGVCGKCHAGRGIKPGEGDTKANVDCLVCHNEEYALARVRKPGPDGLVNTADDIMAPGTATDTMVQNPTRPTKTTCLKCHAFGGGGDGVKRGDLANALVTNTSATYDIHMKNDGANKQCVDCHSFNGVHKVSGKGSDLRPTDFESEVSCSTTTCHAGMDAVGGHTAKGKPSQGDTHVIRVACQACHIPTYGKSATETHRIWRTHHDGSNAEICGIDGNPSCPGHPDRVDQTNLTPTMKPWNRLSDNYLLGDVAVINPDTGNTYQTSMPQGLFGALEDPAGQGFGKLYPFKYKTSEAPISTDGKIIAPDSWEYMKVSGNVYTAIDQGVANMNAAGISVGGFSHWVTTDTYQLISHGVEPAINAGCSNCHGGLDYDTTSMLDGYGYALKDTPALICSQCHKSKNMKADHEGMHNHIGKSGGIDCLFCHTFSRVSERAEPLCHPSDNGVGGCAEFGGSIVNGPNCYDHGYGCP